jgi:hypothetical protein
VTHCMSETRHPAKHGFSRGQSERRRPPGRAFQ